MKTPTVLAHGTLDTRNRSTAFQTHAGDRWRPAATALAGMVWPAPCPR